VEAELEATLNNFQENSRKLEFFMHH